MANGLISLLGDLGLPWVVGAFILLLIFERTGFLQSLYRVQSDQRRSEREQLSDDQRSFIENLQEQIALERRMRVEDARYYLNERDQLRADLRQRDDVISRLTSAIESSERGNARLRHGLNSAYTYIAALRAACRKTGMTVPPYEGWRDMIGVSGDLDETLRGIFREHGME